MNHLLIMPVLLPAVVGPLIVLWMRHDMLLQRVASLLTTAALGVIAVLAPALLAMRPARTTLRVSRALSWPSSTADSSSSA